MSFWNIFKRSSDPTPTLQDARKGATEVGISDGPYYSFWGASTGASGKEVSEDSAVLSSTVYACIRILTQSISTLPINLYKKQKDGSRKHMEDHPLALLLGDQPNPMMTSSDFIAAMQFQALMYNTAYAEIIRNQYGEPVELWPMLSKRMSLEMLDSGEYVYKYTQIGPTGGQVSTLIKPKDLVVIKGVTKNGNVGISIINTARDTIGTSLAADETAAASFKNTSAASGALTVPEGSTLSRESAQQILEGWTQAFGGAVNAGKVCFLPNGVEFKAFETNLEALQLLETRKFQVRDIARIFGVPLHLLADPERQSYNSNEQQGLDFVTHTLRPWLVVWEQALAKALLTPTQRKSIYFEFDTNDLVRGDIATRYNAYQIGVQNGWLSADEVRIKENMEPIPGDVGNQYLVPMNMQSAEHKKVMEDKEASQSHEDAPQSVSIPKGNPDTKTMQRSILDPLASVLEHNMEQILEKERVALSNMVENASDVEDFHKRVTKFAKEHKKYVRHHLEAFLDKGLTEEDITKRYLKTLSEVRNLLDNKEVTLAMIKDYTSQL